MKKVAILQSNYIPWKGYFDIINQVDEFIFYDEMQYTIRDWRNRNKIKTANGLIWLTIPVNGSQEIKISEVCVSDVNWYKKHLNAIRLSYAKATFFKDYEDVFVKLYEECSKYKYLCDINYKFIFAINEIFNIKTKMSFDKDYGVIDGKTERLVDLCKKANATEYLTGPAAKSYINEDLFKQENIKLTYMDYSNYTEYPQLYPPFEHAVSIIDFLFNCGNDLSKIYS